MSRSSDIAVREQLLTGALELFTRKGYAATTVREIVAAAGVTKPALYYHFGKKEGIYLELMSNASAKFVALLDASRHEQGSDVARLMYAIYYGPPQGAPFFDFESSQLKFRHRIRCLIKDGIRQGEFQKRGIEDMVWAALGALNIAIEAQLCHPEEGVGRKGVARILNLVFQGIWVDEMRQKNQLQLSTTPSIR